MYALFLSQILYFVQEVHYAVNVFLNLSLLCLTKVAPPFLFTLLVFPVFFGLGGMTTSQFDDTDVYGETPTTIRWVYEPK